MRLRTGLLSAQTSLFFLSSPSQTSTTTADMAHMLPPHPELNLAPSSLQTALQMDQNQPPPGQQQPPPTQPPPQVTPSRKRKKTDNGEEAPHPAEPRRLRRSHEACARCRSKKIKASPAGRHRRQIPVASTPAFRICLTLSSSISAIPSTQSAQRVRRRAYHATKKTDTVRP